MSGGKGGRGVDGRCGEGKVGKDPEGPLPAETPRVACLAPVFFLWGPLTRLYPWGGIRSPLPRRRSEPDCSRARGVGADHGPGGNPTGGEAAANPADSPGRPQRNDGFQSSQLSEDAGGGESTNWRSQQSDGNLLGSRDPRGMKARSTGPHLTKESAARSGSSKWGRAGVGSRGGRGDGGARLPGGEATPHSVDSPSRGI